MAPQRERKGQGQRKGINGDNHQQHLDNSKQFNRTRRININQPHNPYQTNLEIQPANTNPTTNPTTNPITNRSKLFSLNRLSKFKDFRELPGPINFHSRELLTSDNVK